MSAADIQALLRFLSKDAKVPLASAMGQVKAMQSVGLGTTDEIAKSNADTLKTYFPDDKLAKQVLSAAKRASKKRAAEGTDGPIITPPKRRRKDPFETVDSIPASEIEASLDLRVADSTQEELATKTFTTNRAPLVLAFAYTLLKFTMPEQPPSSRLSLAQAVVSMGAQSKAKSIGLSKDATAEEQGWAQGQPTVRVMGRAISVLKRWGYEWENNGVGRGTGKGQDVSATDVKEEDQVAKPDDTEDSPAFWGIDLEKLKNLNGPLTFTAASADTAGLPVYSPQAAQNYLYRSFDSAPPRDETAKPVQTSKKRTTAMAASEREQNVASLLRALEMLFGSWANSIDVNELDKRAWSWYVHVRPEVEHGVAGWGAKGPLKLADILALRREEHPC